MGFKLYKGLKKPLVLFGLEGKYIYYALGVVVTALFVGGGLNSFFGFYATAVGIIIGLGGIWLIFHLQDTKGLYNKNKTKHELLIVHKKLKKTK